MSGSRITASLLAAVLVIGGASCKDDSPAGPADTGKTIRPTIGSSFTARSIGLDSTGREIAGTERTHTATVIDTGRSFMGRSGLYLIEEDSSRFYLQYEASGDVSIIPADADSSFLETWMTLPFGSKRTIAGPSRDTSFNGVRMTMTTTYTYEGSESTTVPAGTFSTQKVRRLMRLVVSYMGMADTSTQSIDIWFASSVGYVVKQRVMNMGTSTEDSGDLSQLVSYTRK